MRLGAKGKKARIAFLRNALDRPGRDMMTRLTAYVASLHGIRKSTGKLLGTGSATSYMSKLRSSLVMTAEQEFLLDVEIKAVQLQSALGMDICDPLSFAAVGDVKYLVQCLLDTGKEADSDIALAVIIQYSTMSRVGEVAGILSPDIRYCDEGIRVSYRETKAGPAKGISTKTVPNNVWGLDMRSWIRHQAASSPFFAMTGGGQMNADALGRRLKRAMLEYLGDSRMTSHSLRRGAAIEALRHLPEAYVQAFGAWSQRDSMQAYIAPLRTRLSWMHGTGMAY
ncbi:hypothetical protein KIPB_010831 [Kipferlia bialata]|uniref:Tyr recombinase domain-containing protein n=1 Tax=Kipferlia bialata TaxID=797122 RepID=A0A391NUD3_9EUKA|nr:hypothetical protein KIPB_010831 [Kipferlia bialata]|eukprot:g10831.t1